MRDDRDILIEKMMASDGVVPAWPNYSFQVSGPTEAAAGSLFDWVAVRIAKAR